jgi:hypothetical protein
MDSRVTTAPAYAADMQAALRQTLPIVALSIDQRVSFATTGIYSNGRITPDNEQQVSMEYFTPDGLDGFQEDAGIRVHGGNAPLQHPKKPFRIYFRKDYGKGELRFPLYDGSPVRTFDVLQLRPGGHDGWSVPFGSGPESLARHATYCRDRFLRDTQLEMGGLASRGRYVHLYINGLYWGIYDLHEVPNKFFYQSHRGGTAVDWDVLEHSNADTPAFSAVDGTGEVMNQLLTLANDPYSFARSDIYAQATQWIDPANFADYLIVQMWGSQHDWMGPVSRSSDGSDASRFFNKNWESGLLARGPTPGKIFWSSWDAEISMGSSLTSTLVATMRINDFDFTRIGDPYARGGNFTVPGPPAKLYRAMRQNAQFRRLFADRLQKHFFNQGAMTADNNLRRLRGLRQELHLPIIAESARWGDVNGTTANPVFFTRDEHWASELNWMENTYIAQRNEILLGQYRNVGLWPTVQAPVLTPPGGTLGSAETLAMLAQSGAVIYYTLDGSDPAPAAVTTTVNLITPTTPSQYRIANTSYPENSWKNLTDPADIATWRSGTSALGTALTADTAFQSAIRTPITGLTGQSCGVYVRIPFTLSRPQVRAMGSLIARIRYADGFYLFLNGSTPLARINAPPTAPAPTDCASSENGTVIREALVDLSPHLHLLEGNNVLALQGLNGALNDPRFLLSVTLEAHLLPGPSATSTALRYTGATTLPASGTVKARALLSGQWSPLVESSYIVGQPAARSNLVLAEFSYNPVLRESERPAGFTAQQFEFLELLNISASPVELQGVRFDDGISFDFANSNVRQIPPGGRVVLVANASAFALRHPGVPIAGVFANGSNLSNSGERLELLGANGQPIFDFRYTDTPPWPTAADGFGASLVLREPFAAPDHALAENWQASATGGGAPGAADFESYAAWAARMGVSDGPEEDADADGLANFAEYALGGSRAPQVSVELISTENGEEAFGVLRYEKSLSASATCQPEYSTDLRTWLPLTEALESAPLPNAGRTQHAYRAPQSTESAPRLYFRLSIQPWR